MRTKSRRAEIIVRNKTPREFDEPVDYKGQLYLDSNTGRLYQADAAGFGVTFSPFAASGGGEGGGDSYEVRSDTSGGFAYLGKAPAGTSEADEGWTITKISLADGSTEVSEGSWYGREGEV